jgi:hypothetical protein
MIVRICRNGRAFTVVDTALLDDPRLSFKAKGLLVYLLSRPETWRVRRRHLAGVGRDGETAVASALAELGRAGYLERRELRGDDGVLAGTEYHVYERPRQEAGNPTLGEPDPARGKPSVGKRRDSRRTRR